MNIYVDLDSRTAVVSATQRSAIGTIEVKNQDTIDFNIYFVQGGNYVDLTAGAALKFGLVAAGQTTLLVLTTAFAYLHDAAGNPYFQGQPVFNTTQMANAMGTNKSILCTGEIRFEQPDGEIIHTLSIPFQVDLTLVPETGTTPPTVSGTYPDESTLVLLSQANADGGWLQLDSSGLVPDARIPATVERLTNKNQPGGYPGLTAGKVAGGILPIDGSSIGLNGSGQLTLLGTFLASLTDFETTAGVSLIENAAGVLNRLVAGTGITFDTSVPGEITLNVVESSGGITALSDAETSSGLTLISNVDGILKRLTAGTNVTLDATTTPGSIIINCTGYPLTDAETSSGVTLISNTLGVLKRIAAGANVTLDTTTVPGSIIIAAAGGGGGSLTLADEETSTGQTLLGATNGLIKRLVAGTNVTIDNTTTPGALILAASGGGGGSLTLVDAETSAGNTLLGATNGQIKRIIAGTNLTVDTTTTPGALILNAAGGGGGGGAFDPTTGIDETEDFFGAAPWKWNWKSYSSGAGSAPVNVPCISGDKTNGVIQLTTGVGGSGSAGTSGLALGTLIGQDFFTGQQPITITFRARFATTLPTTSKYSRWMIGLFNNFGDTVGTRTGVNNGLFFMFDPSLTGDTSWYAYAMQGNAGAGSLTTGVAADLSWHTFILTIGASHVYSYTIDGAALTVPPASNIDTTALSLGIQGSNFDTGAGEIDLQIDFIRVQQTLAR
jgi:hypothetical protein